MRKALAIFLIMLVALTSFYAYAAIDINKEKDNVTFTETILEGDKAFAYGVSVETSFQYERRLFWDSKLTLGPENSAETKFTFHKNYSYTESENEGSLVFYTEAGYSSSNSREDFTKDISELSGMAKAYKELYDSAVPHKEERKVIYYKDYLDYYPLSGSYDANGDYTNFGMAFGVFEDEENERITKILEDYFKIPVLEDEMREINLIKDDDGTVISLGSSQVTEYSDAFSFYSSSVETDKGLYVIFSNRTLMGEIIDTSLIPGGYGIYFFPYLTKGVNFNKIQTVYPVDQANEIIDITANKNKTKLHLVTKEENELILNVIDVSTMKCQQRLILHKNNKELSADDDFGMYVLETDKDFIVYEIYDDSRFLSVVTIDKNGKYTQSLKVPDISHIFDGDFEYDGEYLYAADYNSDYGSFSGTVAKIIITVIGKDSVKFRGSYNTSLNTGESIQYRSDYYCFPNGDKPVISLSK